MPIQQPNVQNLLYGVSRTYVGASAYSTSPPPDTLPAITVPIGGDVGGTWRYVGLTQGGVRLTINRQFNPIKVDQFTSPAIRIVTESGEMIETTFVETTLANIKDAIGRGAIVTVAPVGSAPSGTPGSDTFRIPSTTVITYVAVLFEGIAPPVSGGLPRRVFFPAVLATGQVQFGQSLADVGKGLAQFTRVGGAEGDPFIVDAHF